MVFGKDKTGEDAPDQEEIKPPSQTFEHEDPDITAIARQYNFIIETSKKDRFVDRIIFDSGEQYRFEHPKFLELHKVIMDVEGSLDHDLFLYGLERLYPDNEKSPRIDEDHFERDRDRGLNLWSLLIRRLLLSR